MVRVKDEPDYRPAILRSGFVRAAIRDKMFDVVGPHLSYAVLFERISALPPAPKDEGSVAAVVVRPAAGERATPLRCRLSPDRGVVGDRWGRSSRRIAAAQVSVMRADVASVIANGQALAAFGDNLLVDLDLSFQNLNHGTRLQIGGAICEVTAKPHSPCAKFADRFGEDARTLTEADAFRSWRLRGLFVQVLVGGDVGPGDCIVVLRANARFGLRQSVYGIL
jgi:hypothetical protein